MVDALVWAVRAAYPRLAHRYYRLKAKWMGKDRLEWWNRNAPLPDDQDRSISWSEAQRMVLEAYNAFSPELGRVARPFFEQPGSMFRRAPGKSPGAFSHPTVPTAHPYILLNYHGKVRDVMALGPRIGHGVHQVLSAPQGPCWPPRP